MRYAGEKVSPIRGNKNPRELPAQREEIPTSGRNTHVCHTHPCLSYTNEINTRVCHTPLPTRRYKEIDGITRALLL